MRNEVDRLARKAQRNLHLKILILSFLFEAYFIWYICSDGAQYRRHFLLMTAAAYYIGPGVIFAIAANIVVDFVKGT